MKKLILIILMLLLATPGWAGPSISGGGGAATDTIYDAAGDIVQGTADNTGAKLTKGAEGTILRAGASLLAYSTSTYPDTGVAYSILAAGAVANIFTAIAPTANGIWGCNGASVCGYYTNIASDDSAYQFYSATASKGTLKFLLSGSTSGKLLTAAFNHTDNKTLNFPDPTTGDSVAYGSAALRFNTGAGTARIITMDDAAQTMARRDAAQTFTGVQTMTAPAITAGEVLYASTWLVSEAAYTFTAAEVSRTIINTYGRGAACDPALPTAAAGYTFIIVVGTQHNSKMDILKGASDLYWEIAGVPTLVAAFSETNEVVGSRASCATFKTGASSWSWLCGSVSGTWDHTDI